MIIAANPLQPLIDVCDLVLQFFHDQVGFGWGASIIGLTVVVRLVILPLTFKQVRSMQAVQQHMPELKRIQERYKDDPQRKQQETMRFYRENKFNPAVACLPLLLQLPFFLALFYMLREDLRVDICGQAEKPCGEVAPGSGEFLFIPDITTKATGAVLVALIVLYVGSQLGASLISLMTVTDKRQRRLFLALPFIFVPVVVSFETGLIVYWITTNLWTVGQQLLVRKVLPPPEPAEPAKGGKAGTSADGKGATGKKAGAAARAGPAGTSGGGDGRPTKAPPRGPRKKKKRSGRRR